MKLFTPNIPEDDIELISKLLYSGDIGFGKHSNILECEFEKFSQRKFNVSTNSASAAAFMIFAYLKEVFGECNVFTPSMGFTSPAWAAKHHGHNIVFVDVDENLLFDVGDYMKKREFCINRPSIVMPVLYGGVSTIPFADKLKDGCDIMVIDSAHCVTPTIDSDFTFFSFHPYKPIAASDGGMISTNDKQANSFFRRYRNFGRETFSCGYNVVSDGFKFYMNNLNCLIASTQLKRYGENLKKRIETFELVKGLFGNSCRILPHDDKSSYYFATVICDGDVKQYLSTTYNTAKHYPMLHKMSYYADGSCLNVTETIHDNIVNLPLYDINIYNS